MLQRMKLDVTYTDGHFPAEVTFSAISERNMVMLLIDVTRVTFYFRDWTLHLHLKLGVYRSLKRKATLESFCEMTGTKMNQISPSPIHDLREVKN